MDRLIVPLEPGATIGHWQLGALHEARFDVPDESMQGGMDARFFLASKRNFIPHEYPCRRHFAALHRGRRPEPLSCFSPERWSFPFGADRVDLSGFWFRPTRVEAWARTFLRSGEAGAARLRLATCGGALVLANGIEAGWLAPYRRNFEEALEITVPIERGDTELLVWFGDLCERDTRYYVALRLIEGPGLEVAVPVATDPAAAATIERLLDGIRFERSSYADGEVALVLPERIPLALSAEAEVTGSFMSAERRTFSTILEPGSARLTVGPAAALPADFSYFHVRLRHGDFALQRTLGVEISAGGPGAAGASLGRRIEETLLHVADEGENGTVRALDLLALARGGEGTDRILRAALPAIADCHDCADFLLVPLLWCRMAWPQQIGEPARAEIDEAILGFRYWLDEPGNDVMWFFSENHALLFHTAAYLAGTLLPDARFKRSGRTGREQQAVGRERLLAWLEHFRRHELAEWNSAPYFPIDLKGLCALLALAPHDDIRTAARRAILRLLEIVALSCHQGVLTASQGRSYEHSLRAVRTLELSGMARLLWGRGWYSKQAHALPQLALCLRDHALRPSPELEQLAFWDGPGGLEWCFRQGEGGLAALYHYKTRHHAMASIAAYRPGQWGYQETVLHARLGDLPEAQLWINHPGELVQSGFARPSYWGGCGTLPRVHQYRSLAVLDFDLKPEHVPFTHAFVPETAFEAAAHEGRDLFVRRGRAMAMLRGSCPIERVAEGPTAGVEYRQAGRQTRWIVRLADDEPSLDAFARRMRQLTITTGADGHFIIDDPDYGTVRCDPAGTVEAEGRTLDPASWILSGTARTDDGSLVRLPSENARETER